jgi:ElaA protein
MKIVTKKFSELTTLELHEIFKLRSEIFVVEQNCVYNDVDGKDIEATHIMIKKNSNIIAYIRVLSSGISYGDAPSIGRVLVIKEARRKGIARKIVQVGIDYIIDILKEEKITIGAQEYLKSFYESLGFISVSDVYLEDGIPHLDMSYNSK